jgi:hypothetical protein
MADSDEARRLGRERARSLLEADAAAPGPSALHIACTDGSEEVCVSSFFSFFFSFFLFTQS